MDASWIIQPTTPEKYTFVPYLSTMYRLASPYRVACVLIALLGIIAPMRIGAQNQNGSIHGTVTDLSGAVIPDAKVTLTSTVLLIPQTSTTSESGIYHFEQLPLGAYKLTFERSGFSSYIRENIDITAGFSAEVNVQMSVGSASQSVTVSSQGPVIDTTSTTLKTDLTPTVLIDQLPVSRIMTEVVASTPALVPTTVPDLSGASVGGLVSPEAYGITGEATPMIEGIDVRQSSNAAGGTWDFTALEDFQVVTSGGNAEIALPGVFVNGLVKTGGNAFHGRGEATGETNALEANNLTSQLKAQGTTTPQLILHDYDLSGQFGGPIKRDKWWFFGSGNLNDSNLNAVGYLLPNGQPGTTPARHTHVTTKTTYQLAPNYKLIGFYSRQTYWAPAEKASPLFPQISTVLFTWPITEWKVEFQATPNPKLVIDFFFGRNQYQANYSSKADPLGIPSQIDQATSLNNGPSLEEDKRPRSSWQPTGSLTFIPSGSYLGHHELKFGSTWMFQSTGTAEPAGTHGNYTLTFDKGVPAFIGVFNMPVVPVTKLHEGGFYGEDTWQISKHVTIDLGLRMDVFTPFVPPQTKQPGTFGPPWTIPSNPNLSTGGSASYSQVNIGSWKNPAPRVGAAWDLFGQGKTVLKASWGRFNWTMGDDFGNAFDLNSATETTFKWTEANAGCTNSLTPPYAPVAPYCDYTPGTVDLNPNGPAYVKIAGGTGGGGGVVPNTALNPNIPEQHTDEYQGAVEHQVSQGFSLRAAYTYVQNLNIWAQVPNQIPYSAWSVAVPVYDPGPGATLTSTPIAGKNPIILHDITPNYVGAAFSQQIYISRPNQDHFGTIEVTAIKRPGSGRWNMLASYTATRDHRWISSTYLGYPTNPNQQFFPVDTSWNWQSKLSATYNLPWKLQASGLFEIYNGLQGERSSTYNLPNSGSTTIFLEPYAAETAPMRPLLNLRFARPFQTEKYGQFRPSLEILNSLNSAAPWTVSWASGTNFNRFTATDTPLVLRGGLVYSF